MSGVDKILTKRETRKNIRNAQSAVPKQKYVADQLQVHTELSHSPPRKSISASSSSAHSEGEFKAPIVCYPLPTKRMSKKGIVSKEVASALDRVKQPDRGAMLFVVGTVSQSLAVEIEDIALSRSTITQSSVSAAGINEIFKF